MAATGGVTSRKIHMFLLILLILVFVAVYNRKYFNTETSPDKDLILFNQHKSTSAVRWNALQVDSGIALVSDGDLIARTGNDEISEIFRRFNTHDATYSHIGIVFFDNGYPFVYNIIAGKDNPDGIITRDSLTNYIGPENNLGFGIYRLALSKGQKDQLHEHAIKYIKENRKFDLSFDLKTDSLLYCTEFVYKLVSETIGKKDYFIITHSEDMNFNYITVDDILAQKKIRMMCKVRYKQ